jgi:hypothetical protein
VVIVSVQPYEAKAAADKERYQAEMANYSPPSDDEDDGGKKGKKKKAKTAKDPNKPKKNLNAYMFFAKDMRPKIVEDHPEVKGQAKEITRLIGEKWNALNESQKKVRILCFSCEIVFRRAASPSRMHLWHHFCQSESKLAFCE